MYMYMWLAYYGGVLISEGVVLCTGFNVVESGPEDVSLLERCPSLLF